MFYVISKSELALLASYYSSETEDSIRSFFTGKQFDTRSPLEALMFYKYNLPLPKQVEVIGEDQLEFYSNTAVMHQKLSYILTIAYSTMMQSSVSIPVTTQNAAFDDSLQISEPVSSSNKEIKKQPSEIKNGRGALYVSAEDYERYTKAKTKMNHKEFKNILTNILTDILSTNNNVVLSSRTIFDKFAAEFLNKPSEFIGETPIIFHTEKHPGLLPLGEAFHSTMQLCLDMLKAKVKKQELVALGKGRFCNVAASPDLSKISGVKTVPEQTQRQKEPKKRKPKTEVNTKETIENSKNNDVDNEQLHKKARVVKDGKQEIKDGAEVVPEAKPMDVENYENIFLEDNQLEEAKKLIDEMWEELRKEIKNYDLDDSSRQYHQALQSTAMAFNVLTPTKTLIKHLERDKDLVDFPSAFESGATGPFLSKTLPGDLRLYKYGNFSAFPLIAKPMHTGYLFSRDSDFEDKEKRKALLKTYYVALQNAGESEYAAKFLLYFFRHSLKHYFLIDSKVSTGFKVYLNYELQKLGLPLLNKKTTLIKVTGCMSTLESTVKTINKKRILPPVIDDKQEEIDITGREPQFSKLLNKPIKIIKIKRQTVNEKLNTRLDKLPDDAILVTHDDKIKHHGVILNDPIIHVYDQDTNELVCAYYSDCISEEDVVEVRNLVAQVKRSKLTGTGAKRADDVVSEKGKEKIYSSKSAILGINGGKRAKNVALSEFTVCHKTNAQLLISTGKLIKDSEKIYAEFAPKEAAMMTKKMKDHRELLLPYSEIFTTADYNFDKQTNLHYDDNNVAGFRLRPLTVFWPNGEKCYEGGYTYLADYNVAFDLKERCFLWAHYDKILHANTPLIIHEDLISLNNNPERFARISMVPFTKEYGFRKAIRHIYENSDDEADIQDGKAHKSKIANALDENEDLHSELNPLHRELLKGMSLFDNKTKNQMITNDSQGDLIKGLTKR